MLVGENTKYSVFKTNDRTINKRTVLMTAFGCNGTGHAFWQVVKELDEHGNVESAIDLGHLSAGSCDFSCILDADHEPVGQFIFDPEVDAHSLELVGI